MLKKISLLIEMHLLIFFANSFLFTSKTVMDERDLSRANNKNEFYRA